MYDNTNKYTKNTSESWSTTNYSLNDNYIILLYHHAMFISAMPFYLPIGRWANEASDCTTKHQTIQYTILRHTAPYRHSASVCYVALVPLTRASFTIYIVSWSRAVVIKLYNRCSHLSLELEWQWHGGACWWADALSFLIWRQET